MSPGFRSRRKKRPDDHGWTTRELALLQELKSAQALLATSAKFRADAQEAQRDFEAGRLSGSRVASALGWHGFDANTTPAKQRRQHQLLYEWRLLTGFDERRRREVLGEDFIEPSSQRPGEWVFDWHLLKTGARLADCAVFVEGAPFGEDPGGREKVLRWMMKRHGEQQFITGEGLTIGRGRREGTPLTAKGRAQRFRRLLHLRDDIPEWRAEMRSLETRLRGWKRD